jgi:Tfp pilus assembly protein PilX
MVLLTVLLFLTMISVLVLAMLDTSLLETKMSNNYLNKMQLFYSAEAKLKQNERAILSNQIPAGAELMQQICGIDLYQVIIEMNDTTSSKIKLQSTVAKVGDISKCDPKPKISAGRQSFRKIF